MVWPLRKKISATEILQQADKDEQQQQILKQLEIATAVAKTPEIEHTEHVQESEQLPEEVAQIKHEPTTAELAEAKINSMYDLILNDKYEFVKYDENIFLPINFDPSYDGTDAYCFDSTKLSEKGKEQIVGFAFNKYRKTSEGHTELMYQLFAGYTVSVAKRNSDYCSCDVYWLNNSYDDWLCLTMHFCLYDKWRNAEVAYLTIPKTEYSKHLKLIKDKLAITRLKHVERLCSKVFQ